MKKRLDILLLEKKLVKSRNEAINFIMQKRVKVNGKIIDKAGTQINEDAQIVLNLPEESFVSRGGLKLSKAIKQFKINLKNKICLDIGASTGGFTDCMLQNGAKKVYALDVGYGQLDWKLRNDERVVNIEKMNFRNWDAKELQDKIEFVSIDVSFISLTKIFPNLKNILKEQKYFVVALIKPQFEAGKDKVGKNGVVKEEQVRKEIVDNILKFLENNKYQIFGVCESPIKGPAGNVEYLVYCSKIEEDV